MKLGQILLHRGIIGRDQLREALRRQRRGDGPLGEILLRMGIVSRDQVVAALLTQPSASVDEATLARIQPGAASLLPEPVARQYQCLGLVEADGYLVVAMADPLDRRAIDAVQRATSLSVLAVAAPREALRDTISSRYGSGDAAVARAS